MRVTRLLNLRRLRHQPLRAVLAALAVGAGVALVVSVAVLALSTTESLGEFGRRVGGPAPLRVIPSTPRGGLDAAVVAKVQATQGVAFAVPAVQALTYVSTRGGGTETVVAVGLECLPLQAVTGRSCEESGPAGRPLLSASLARRSTAGGHLATNAGPLPLAGAEAVPKLDEFNDGNVVVFRLDEAQRLYGRGSRIDAIYVQPGNGVSVESLRERLVDVVGESNGVLRSSDPPPGTRVAALTSLSLFALLGVFTLGIGALLIYNVVALSIEDRRRELAVVGALGAPAKVLVGGTIIEAALLGLVGGLLGTAGAVVLAHPLAESLSATTERVAGIPITVHLNAAVVALGAALGAGVAALAAAPPARRALKLDVAAELSMRDLRAERAPRASATRAAAALAVGVLGVAVCWASQNDGGLAAWQLPAGPVGLLLTTVGLLIASASAASLVANLLLRLLRNRSGSFRLGVANLVQQPRRTAVTVLAVAAAVAVAFSVQSERRSIRAGIAASVSRLDGREVEVSVAETDTPNLDVRLSDELVDRLARVPGVQRINRVVTMLSGRSDASLVSVTASDEPRLHWPVIDGAGDRESFAREQVMVGPALARSRDLRAGSTLDLDTPSGRREVAVGGLWADGTLNGNAVTMAMPLFERLYGRQPPDKVGLVPEPGVTTDELASRVRAAALQPGLHVRTPEQVAARRYRDAAQQIAAFDVLQRGLLLVAFVAVLSTLLLVGLQRRRELGLLGAVGMDSGQFARMALSEGVTIGVIGSLLSVLGALAIFVAFHFLMPLIVGFRDPLRFAWDAFFVWGPIVVVVTVLAAALPAWRTARTPIIDAIRAE